MPIQFLSLPSTCRHSGSYLIDLPWYISSPARTLRKRWKDVFVHLLKSSTGQTAEKIFLLTVTRRQKKSIYAARFAVMEGATDPQAA